MTVIENSIRRRFAIDQKLIGRGRMADLQKTILFCTLGLSAGVNSLTPATAQESNNTQTQSTENTGFDSVVVRGRKRSTAEELQETPISATAFSAAQVESALNFDLADIGRYAPSASLQKSTQRGTQNFSIRGMGVSSSSPSDEPTVGIHQDGIFWGSNYGAITQLFDVESLEVLRGPQGTLFGRNVTAGAILIRSARPSGEFSLEGGFGGGNGGMREAWGVVNGPLSDGSINGRLAISFNENDGYYFNQTANESIGATRHVIVRPSVTFEPTENASMTLIGEYYRLDADPTTIVALDAPGSFPATSGFIAPDDFFTVESNFVPDNKLDVYSLVLDTEWRVGPGVLSAIIGYRDVFFDGGLDGDGTQFTGFHALYTFDQKQFSSEIRYAGENWRSDIIHDRLLLLRPRV